jgi:hypothetical protein
MQYAVRISTVCRVEQADAAEESLGGAFLSWKRRPDLMQEAKLSREMTICLPNTLEMCPQVGAFGLAKGVYLRTGHDIWLAQNGELTGPQSRNICPYYK